jgi:transposase
VLDINALPNCAASLKNMVIEQHRQIEHLKLQLARLRRWRFGQSSERVEGIEQLALLLEELEASLAKAEASVPSSTETTAPETPPVRRKEFPEHFERIDNRIEPDECACPECGGPLSNLGKPDVAEVLEVKTITFTVTRHIRPKKRCGKCSIIVQAPAPSRPIERSYAGASFLALVLCWKYAFALPLYRQCRIFETAGLIISRTTLMEWVGASAELLGPLVAALGKYVLSAPNINADDTPVKVLDPGAGKTKKGHLWSYVRDGRPWGSTDPPAAWYRYSPSWHGRYPQRHLAGYVGKLQADGYAGYEPLYVPCAGTALARVLEVACFAHCRRKFFDVYEATHSAIAEEALDRIRALYQLEEEIRYRSAPERQALRKDHAVPLLSAMHSWMVKTHASIDQKGELAKAFNYAFNHWAALLRYTEDGQLEIDNNAAERSLRGVGVGRRNFLFFGSDSGGDRAAIIYSLIETCRMNQIDPQRYLQYVLERIAEHPINRIEELLPWNVRDQLKQPAPIARALAA